MYPRIVRDDYETIPPSNSDATRSRTCTDPGDPTSGRVCMSMRIAARQDTRRRVRLCRRRAEAAGVGFPHEVGCRSRDEGASLPTHRQESRRRSGSVSRILRSTACSDTDRCAYAKPLLEQLREIGRSRT